VLSAVFLPCAFIRGIVGQFFLQFALTIAISTIISAFNSLTLSPALAVLLLKPKTRGKHGSGSVVGEALPRLGFVIAGALAAANFLTPLVMTQFADQLAGWPVPPAWIATALASIAGGLAGWLVSWPINWLLMRLFWGFNWVFGQFTRAYVGSVGLLLRGSLLVLAGYGGLLYLTYHTFETTPTGFIPSQDKGYLLVNIRLPDSASLERTGRVIQQIEKVAGKTPGVRHTVAIAGQSILLGASAPNFGSMYVMLDDFHERAEHAQSASAISASLQEQLEAEVSDAVVNIAGAPPIDGLGTAGGFKIVIEDRGDNGLAALQRTSQQIVDEGRNTSGLDKLFTSFRADTTWLFLDIDRDAAEAMGISMADVFNMLQVNLGTLYINDFNRFGRTWQVNVQADARFRMQGDDLSRLYVRSDRDRMVPLMSFAKLRQVSGPVMLNRYNLYSAATVNADAAPGTSSGQAIDLLEKVAKSNTIQSMRPEWTELALLQLQAGNTAMYAFLLAVVLVFLVLAAQYESWSLPLAVILVVPMCLLCSVFGVVIAKMDINIFTQIGFVVLVGLACKNAILIVEFARARHLNGVPRFQATLEACRLRLRPIVMTSLAFIFGVVPLVLGEGAGSEMRRTLGVAVFAGMIGVTIFGVFLTPVFFYVIQAVTDFYSRHKRRPA